MTEAAIQGLGRLAAQRKAEDESLANAIQRAIDLFNAHPSGILEVELGRMLRSEGFRQSYVGAGLDVLRSRGLAIKNWRTGFLSHASNERR